MVGLRVILGVILAAHKSVFEAAQAFSEPLPKTGQFTASEEDKQDDEQYQ